MVLEKMKSIEKIRVHFTNVTGLGATKLLESLLPAIELNDQIKNLEFFAPSKGKLSRYSSLSPKTKIIKLKRTLPNAISRFFECIFPNKIFNEPIPVLVLGDIPLRCNAPQILFLQSPLLLKPKVFIWSINNFKYAVSRFIFHLNSSKLKAVIVQTEVMKERALETYPILKGKIFIVSQPVPNDLKKAINKLKENKKTYQKSTKLNLIYPAAFYPHKNHDLLRDVDFIASKGWPISSLKLTIKKEFNPNPAIDWIHCVAELNNDQLAKEYIDNDALVFLSKQESYGFPLIEAMYCGLPILCSDMPFTRTLCGNEAIYFNPNNIDSLHLAILELEKRLQIGWRPDWSSQMSKISNDWNQAASKFINICI